MDTPQDFQQKSNVDLTKGKKVSEGANASNLCKDMNVDMNNKGFALPEQNLSLYSKNSGLNNNLAIPKASSDQKIELAGNSARQLIEFLKPDMANIPGGLSTSSNDEIESLTFGKGDNVSASPKNKEDSRNLQYVKEEEFNEIETKEAQLDKNTEDCPKDHKDKNIKIFNMLEEYKNKRAQNPQTGNEPNQASVQESENTKSLLELIRINTKEGTVSPDLCSVDARKGLENAHLNNELQQPESFHEIEESRIGGETIKTVSIPAVGASNFDIADPVSLGNCDDSVVHLNTSDIGSGLGSSITKFTEPPSYGSLEKLQALRIPKLANNFQNAKPIQNTYQVVEKSKSSSTSPMNRATSQEKKPKEVEVALMFENGNKARVEQKPVRALPLKGTEVSHTPKSLGGMLSPNKTTFGSGDNRANVNELKTKNQNPATKGNVVGRRSLVKESAPLPNNTNYSPPANSLKSSPVKKPDSYAKARNLSSLVGSPKENTDITNNHAAETSYPGKTMLKQRQNAASMSIENGKKLGDNKAGPDLTRARRNLTLETRDEFNSVGVSHKEALKSPSGQLQAYLREDKLQSIEIEEKEKEAQLEMIEANLRKIQEKYLLSPSQPKKERNPSFGGPTRGVEKEKKVTRRTVSQDAQYQETLKQAVNSVVKSPQRRDIDHSRQSSNGQATLNKVEESQEKKQKSPPRVQEPRPTYSAFEKPRDLRKNLGTGGAIVNMGERRQTATESHNMIINTSSDSNLREIALQSIYSPQANTEGLQKKAIDIYERNSMWLSLKQNKVDTLAVTKVKNEMEECTFKPQRNSRISVESVYSQKNFNNFAIQKFLTEASHSPERLSISKEKKALNSYKGIHYLKKEVVGVNVVDRPMLSPQSHFSGKRGWSASSSVYKTNN